jgi:hypothetical protein
MMEFDENNLNDDREPHGGHLARIEELFAVLDLAESQVCGWREVSTSRPSLYCSNILCKQRSFAKLQVSSSADKTIKEIDSYFDGVSVALAAAIESRKQVLTAEVLRAKAEGIASLKPYREAVGSKLCTIPESDTNFCSAINKPGKRGKKK